MKLAYISDIHLEFYKDPYPVLDNLSAELQSFNIDVLIIAGDFCYISYSREYLAYLGASNPDVDFFYVTGNHEYYHNHYQKNLKMFDMPLPYNVYFAEGNVFRIGDIDIIGVGGLTDGSWVDIYSNQSRYDRLNDFHLIKDYKFLKKTSKWHFEKLKKNVAGSTAIHKIVVSHVLPSPKCIALKFQGDSFNHCYANEWTEFIEESDIDYWIHGHSHDRLYVMIGNTMVLRNPYGYPDQPKATTMIEMLFIGE